jgi:hypothetical protein
VIVANDREPLAASLSACLAVPPVQVYSRASGDPRSSLVNRERFWANAMNHAIADDITREQAVHDAIARIKQILNE